VTHNGSGVAALCVDDCNPYGIRFMADTSIASYPGGPCIYSGILQFQLSTLIPTAQGSAFVYSRTTNANWSEGWSEPTSVFFASLDPSGAVTSQHELSANGIPWSYSPTPQLAPFPGGYLAGWVESGTGLGVGTERLARLDGSGNIVGEVETTPHTFKKSEFITFGNGDVGWATQSQGDLAIARITGCSGANP
jgi:hypothetical protein